MIVSALCEVWITGTVFVAVVLLLRLIVPKALPKALFYHLWNCAALLLLVPVRVPSPLSVYSMLFSAPAPGGTAGAGVWGVSVLPAGGDAALGGLWSAPALLLAAGSLLGVVLCLFLRILWGRRLGRAAKLDWPEHLPEFSGPFPRSVSLYRSDAVDAPCMTGILHIRVYFPCSWDVSDLTKTRMALAHELAHARHLDNLRKLVFTLLLCLYWYHPLVWGFFYYANLDMELYCDQRVIRTWGGDVRAAYAHMVLSESSGPVTLNPNSSLAKYAVTERIVSIMERNKVTIMKNLLAFFCFAALLLLFGTGFSARFTPRGAEADAPVSSPPIVLLGTRDSVNGVHFSPDTMPQDVGVGVVCPADVTPPPYIEPDRAILDYQAWPVKFSNGELLRFYADAAGTELPVLFSLASVEGFLNGQTVEYGYLSEGEPVPQGTLKLSDGMVIPFAVPGPGVCELYLKNDCSDSIYINSICLDA